MQEFIVKNLITIILIFLLVYSFVKGFAAGFFKKILSFASIIVTIFATKILTPTLATMVKDITNIEATLTDGIYDILINSKLYDKLNVEWIQKNIDTQNIGVSIKNGLCTNIANALINLVCGIVIFIVVLIVIKLILKILDVVDYIPVVGQLNKLLGGVLGVCEMIVIIWVLFTILKILENVPQVSVIVENIEGSPLTNILYDNNLVYNFLFDLLSVFKK